MVRLFIILFIAGVSIFAKDDFPAQLGKQKVIHGPKLKAQALKGKVILVKYWGYK